MIDAALIFPKIKPVNKKALTVETRELSPATKRAIRDIEAGRGLVSIGSTRKEIHEWVSRVYEGACKKKKV